jgi:uncharacterized protein (TIGR03086 family)
MTSEEHLAELHRRSVEHFTALVRSVEGETWQAPTPCADWDVRALVNHVVVEDLWTPPLMRGATLEEVGDAFDGDQLGDDSVGACETAGRAAVEAVGEPGALARSVHLSFGVTPASEYVWQLFADHLIHAWDLARATGQDERLDPELVDAVSEWFAANEDAYRASGAIGPRPQLPDDADAQTRLLAAFGRAG